MHKSFQITKYETERLPWLEGDHQHLIHDLMAHSVFFYQIPAVLLRYQH